MTTPCIILASSSPRRRELLSRLVDHFEVIEPLGLDESSTVGRAHEIAERLSVLKAENVLGTLAASKRVGVAEAFVLGADTVVTIMNTDEEVVLGKPLDREDARRMLRLLSGRSHHVWTGVAVARCGIATVSAAECTEVAFKPLLDSELETYLSTGDWEGKAGAYGIQSHGSTLVRYFMGCYYNVVGLPLGLTARLLVDAAVAEHTCDCPILPLQGMPATARPRLCGRR